MTEKVQHEHDDLGLAASPLAGRLRGLRERQGLSMAALASRAAINRSTISRWESGASLPSIPELERVAAALALSRSESESLLGLIQAPRANRRLREAGRTVVAAELLRALRLRSSLTQAQLADQIGVARSSVLTWERSEAWPSEGHLRSLVLVLGTTSEETDALRQGALPPDDPRPLALDELHNEVEGLQARIFAGDATLSDLTFLRLRSALETHAGANDSARLRLFDARTCYAHWLFWHNRTDEASAAALDNLRDVRREAPRGVWLWNLHLLANRDAAVRGGALRAARRVREWLPYAALCGDETWLLRMLAEYLAAARLPDEATDYSETAMTLAAQRGSPLAIRYSRFDHACLLLQTGATSEAMEYLPDDPSGKFPLQDAAEHLAWAEAHLNLDNPNEAVRHLSSANTTLAQIGTPSLRNRARRIGEKLVEGV